MNEETDRLYKEGIGLEYDPNNRVLHMHLIFQDGDSKSIDLNREKAMMLYRSLGEMLGPDADA